MDGTTLLLLLLLLLLSLEFFAPLAPGKRYGLTAGSTYTTSSSSPVRYLGSVVLSISQLRNTG